MKGTASLLVVVATVAAGSDCGCAGSSESESGKRKGRSRGGGSGGGLVEVGKGEHLAAVVFAEESDNLLKVKIVRARELMGCCLVVACRAVEKTERFSDFRGKTTQDLARSSLGCPYLWRIS